ncbi:hypothetical protein Tco_1240052 [Tanacetum coccineum]
MTQDAINELITKRADEALKIYDDARIPEIEAEIENEQQDDHVEGDVNNGNCNGNGNGNPNVNNEGIVPVARECTYQYFVKCQLLNFKGTEGVVGLTRWFEKMETVFHISKFPPRYQVNYASCTLMDGALTCTWMEFGGNTRDLGSFGEEMNKITDLHQIQEEVLFIEGGDGVAGIKRRNCDLFSDGVRDLATASGCGRLKEDLESSTRTINQSAGNKLRDRNAKESWALLEDLALYDNKSWNEPRDLTKPVKAITLPKDIPINKITTSCEICSGPHDTQYCMEDLEQAFAEYASSSTDEAEVLKAITNRIAGTLPSNTVKNPKLSTSSVLFAHSYLTEDPQCSTHIHGSINTITIHPKQQNNSHDCMADEEEQERKGDPEDTNTIAYIEGRRDAPLCWSRKT